MLIKAQKKNRRFILTYTYILRFSRKKTALLDLLIAASREDLLSDLDIRHKVDTFIVGVCISKLSVFLFDELFGCISIV